MAVVAAAGSLCVCSTAGERGLGGGVLGAGVLSCVVAAGMEGYRWWRELWGGWLFGARSG